MKRTLAVILIIALLLFGATFALSGLTRQTEQRAHLWLMETLLPGGEDFVRLNYAGEDPVICSVHKADIGFVIETATRGYADEIVMWIGVDNAGKVTGLVTEEAHETLGIGSRILSDHGFLAQFLNRSGNFAIATPGADAFSSATNQTASSDNEIAVDGISGATVSSKAVARCVNSAIAYVTGADVSSSATEWGG